MLKLLFSHVMDITSACEKVGKFQTDSSPIHTWSIFTQMLPIYIPTVSGETKICFIFVSSMSDLCSAFICVMLYAISCYTEPCYMRPDWIGIRSDFLPLGHFYLTNILPMTSLHGNITSITVDSCRKSTGHQWIPCTKGQLYRSLMFSLMLGWTSSWTNCQVASHLRHHDAYVMSLWCPHCGVIFIQGWF